MDIRAWWKHVTRCRHESRRNGGTMQNGVVPCEEDATGLITFRCRWCNAEMFKSRRPEPSRMPLISYCDSQREILIRAAQAVADAFPKPVDYTPSLHRLMGKQSPNPDERMKQK